MNNCSKNEDKFVEHAINILEEFFDIEDFVGEYNSEFHFNEDLRNNVNNPVDQMLFEDDDKLVEKEEQEVLDKYANYNILSYQGKKYYVKKKNKDLPVYVMNDDLVHVGIIGEDDINNIKMI